MLSSTELGLDTSSISISRDGAHIRVIGIGVSMVPGYVCTWDTPFYGDRSNLSLGHQKWRLRVMMPGYRSYMAYIHLHYYTCTSNNSQY